MAKKAEIVIDESVLRKVSSRSGVYANLPRASQLDVRRLADKLRPIIVDTIKVSFMKYALAHKGCTNETADKEWNRFHKILEKNL